MTADVSICMVVRSVFWIMFFVFDGGIMLRTGFLVPGWEELASSGWLGILLWWWWM